jgi:DNA-binding XRE family transcriptional regulator
MPLATVASGNRQTPVWRCLPCGGLRLPAPPFLVLHPRQQPCNIFRLTKRYEFRIIRGQDLEGMARAATSGGRCQVTPGDRIRRYRVAQGLSQRALALKAGVRQAMVSDLETNKLRSTQLAIFEKLARALGVSVSQLVESGTDDPRRPPQARCAWKLSMREGGQCLGRNIVCPV